MKFQVLSITGHTPHPLTGQLPSPAVVAILDPVRVAIQPRAAYAKLIAHYRERFEEYGHDLQSLTVDGFGLERGEQIETLQRFAEEVAPVVRRAAPSTLWDGA